MRTNHRSESRPLGVRMLLFASLGLFAAAAAGAAARAVAIVDAAKAEDSSTIRTLLEQQVDVNAAEADGTTALHWAAYQGDVETARLLLAAGARTEVTNRYGVTPLALAAGRGDARIVEALLDAGADPNATLPRGRDGPDGRRPRRQRRRVAAAAGPRRGRDGERELARPDRAHVGRRAQPCVGHPYPDRARRPRRRTLERRLVAAPVRGAGRTGPGRAGAAGRRGRRERYDPPAGGGDRGGAGGTHGRYRGHQRARHRRDQRALLTREIPGRTGRGPQRGRAGLERPAPVVLHAPPELRQGHAPGSADRQPRHARVRAVPAGERRRPEPAPRPGDSTTASGTI